jgi:hypothetical protein
MPSSFLFIASTYPLERGRTLPSVSGVAQSELELALADAGGASAPREYGARLRRLLFAELERGARELAEARTGRERPIAVALARRDEGLLAALPLDPRLRADPAAVPDRGFELAVAAVGALVEASEPGPPASASELGLLMGADDDRLVLSYPADELGWRSEYAREALDEASRHIDRLRARTYALPGHVLEPSDLRPPTGATHPLRVAETISRLGGSPLDGDSADALEEQVLALLEPPGAMARAHDDPDPRRRTMRRILQRLDGMGKWGGYQTAFDHLARGFAGNERGLANEVGEELVAAGLLATKPSVGQRHVFLNPRKAGEIRRLIDEGELPAGLERP